jgi:DNA invertase Pin-like site-specific DNA recombinase
MAKGKGKRAAIYARVSTDQQTTANQLRELRAVAERRGWTVTAEHVDRGISGAKGREQRPAFDQLCRDVTQGKCDVVMAWSVDRLGRSLQDLVAFLGELQGASADLYLHQQGLDTSTPAGRALFQMLGVFAEFERALIRERVLAGLARARAQGRVGGRPRVGDDVSAKVRALRADGLSVGRITQQLGVGSSTVQRILSECAA